MKNVWCEAVRNGNVSSFCDTLTITSRPYCSPLRQFQCIHALMHGHVWRVNVYMYGCVRARVRMYVHVYICMYIISCMYDRQTCRQLYVTMAVSEDTNII